jgi:uncharacterized protein involved in response to NO
MNKSTPLLSIGFRPFFLLTALMATFWPTAWVMMLQGRLNYHGHFFEDITWHGYEMVFGMPSALLAGFLLTASSNWTKSKPTQGAPLLLLIILWLAERTINLLPLPSMVVFLGNLPFWGLLSYLLIKKLWSSPRQRNVFGPFLLAFYAAKILSLYAIIQNNSDLALTAEHTGLSLIRLVLVLIAGRVVPFFSKNPLPEVSIQVPNWVNIFSILPLVILCLPLDFSSFPHLSTLLYGSALFFNAIKLSLWKPNKALKVPILFILHLGMFWLLVDLALELIGVYNQEVLVTQTHFHALALGYLGVSAIGMMTRVSLGHTGRKLEASRFIILMYICVFLGAAVRVFTPLLNFDWYIPGLHYASGLWTAGFFFYLIKFVPILISQRPDGKAF